MLNFMSIMIFYQTVKLFQFKYERNYHHWSTIGDNFHCKTEFIFQGTHNFSLAVTEGGGGETGGMPPPPVGSKYHFFLKKYCGRGYYQIGSEVLPMIMIASQTQITLKYFRSFKV